MLFVKTDLIEDILVAKCTSTFTDEPPSRVILNHCINMTDLSVLQVPMFWPFQIVCYFAYLLCTKGGKITSFDYLIFIGVKLKTLLAGICLASFVIGVLIAICVTASRIGKDMGKAVTLDFNTSPLVNTTCGNVQGLVEDDVFVFKVISFGSCKDLSYEHKLKFLQTLLLTKKTRIF